MPMVKFQIYTFIGSWPWCFGLCHARSRHLVHTNHPTPTTSSDRFDAVIVAIGMLLGARWDSDPTMKQAAKSHRAK
jgi:membrane protein DedA with SNARE-associated domain